MTQALNARQQALALLTFGQQPLELGWAVRLLACRSIRRFFLVEWLDHKRVAIWRTRDFTGCLDLGSILRCTYAACARMSAGRGELRRTWGSHREGLF